MLKNNHIIYELIIIIINTCLRPRTWWGRWWGLPLVGWSPGPEEEEIITRKMRIKMIRLLARIINYLSFNYCGDDLVLGCPLWLHQGLCCLYAWLQFGNKTQLENENRPRTKIKILWLPSSFPGSKFLHMSALLKMVSTLNLGLKFVHQFERI